MKYILYIYNFFCSLKLAIIIIFSMIILFAIGTFYESSHGRNAAQEVIYTSIYMTILITCLALNIIAVMIDRWPWKTKHSSFLGAHFGILFVIIGSLVTQFYGVDGNMRLALNKTSQHINTAATSLMVYSSFDAKNLTQLYQQKVQFFKNPPTPTKPHLIQLGSNVLQVTNFYAAATAREQYKKSLKGGSALYFQIMGSQAQLVKWIYKPYWKNKVKLLLGPAQVILSNNFSHFKDVKIDRPTLLLVSDNKKLTYKLLRPASKKILKGVLKKGSIIKTDWMDFKFRVLEYFPTALPNTIFTAQKKSGEQTNPAIEVKFKKQTRWMGLNSHLFFFEDNKVFVVAYINQKKPIGFKIKLKKFKVTHYPASFKAKSYESKVEINNKIHLISMNEPLKVNDYTIYQSGFEEDDKGVPVASVFAINKDPGRFIKYFGSVLIILGALLLFIRRNKKHKLQRK